MSNNAQILARMKVLEAELNDSANQLGKESGLGNGTVDKWNDNQIEKPTTAVQRFLDYWEINPEWWKTMEGDVFLTSVQKSTDIAASREMSYEETIEGLIKNLRENNVYLKEQLSKIVDSNEQLRADLRNATDGALKLATIALTDGKK